jgi:gamma-glutamyltranspeptidase/glutathione hydrolase
MAQHMQKIKKRFKMFPFSIQLNKPSQRRGWRQITALSFAAMLVVGCSNPFSDDEPEVKRGTIGFLSGALGVISVEEPQAAIIARDILSSGGSAADAATAITFALTATMPSAASLAGGGICIVRDNRNETPDVVDFLPRAAALPNGGSTRPSAIPALPRGIFLMHSKYGKLKWEQVIAPAENLARFGYQVSRAFAENLDKVADPLMRDKVAAQVFRRQDGTVIAEGDVLRQTDLAVALGRIRLRGVGQFYSGPEAQRLVQSVRAAGGNLTIEELRDYRPSFNAPITLPWEKNTEWHFAGPPAAGGAVAAEMMAILMRDKRFEFADQNEREHLLAEAAKFAFVNRMKHMQRDGTYAIDVTQMVQEDYLDRVEDQIDDDKAIPLSQLITNPVNWPETPSAVSFAVMDIFGGAAACTLTLNNIFGTGRMIPGFGSMMAASPDDRGRTYTPLGPALLTSEYHNHAYMAAAGSGGVAAPTSMINVIARAAAGPLNLRDAMRAPRVHYAGAPDRVFVEGGMSAEQIEALKQKGHDVSVTKSIGSVSAVYCPTGIPNNEGILCLSASDPRGHGIALGGN